MTGITRASFAAAGAVGLALMLAYLGRREVGGGPPAPSASAALLTLVPPPAAPPPAPQTGSATHETPPWVDAAPIVSPLLDEAPLMTRLRSLRQRDPQAAIELARQGNERFPESADAPERSSILIHALASQGQEAEARGEAESVVNRYPDSPWIREIESFTGAHRHRNVHLEADGSLQIY
jgi:hypothetical protein